MVIRLIINSTLAASPSIIAIAVIAITHSGSFSLKCDPSGKSDPLQGSTHPEIANSVKAGPRAPHIMGVTLAQYKNQWRGLLSHCELDDASDTLDRLRLFKLGGRRSS